MANRFIAEGDNMSSNWYYSKEGPRIGPYDFDQLKQLAVSGMLMPNDKVWNQGASIWVAAVDVPGLMPENLLVAPVPSAGATRKYNHPRPIERQATTVPASNSQGVARDAKNKGWWVTAWILPLIPAIAYVTLKHLPEWFGNKKPLVQHVAPAPVPGKNK
jgi:GYF domain 2